MLFLLKSVLPGYWKEEEGTKWTLTTPIISLGTKANKHKPTISFCLTSITDLQMALEKETGNQLNQQLIRFRKKCPQSRSTSYLLTD